MAWFTNSVAMLTLSCDKASSNLDRNSCDCKLLLNLSFSLIFHHSLLCSVSLQLDGKPMESDLAGLNVFVSYEVINNTPTIVMRAGLFTIQITNNSSV